MMGQAAGMLEGAKGQMASVLGDGGASDLNPYEIFKMYCGPDKSIDYQVGAGEGAALLPVLLTVLWCSLPALSSALWCPVFACCLVWRCPGQ